MVDANKNKLKRIMRFKTNHVNNVVVKYLKFVKREDDDGVIYEDIYLLGKLIGYFKYEASLITFKDLGVNETCAEDCEKPKPPMNSLPQS